MTTKPKEKIWISIPGRIAFVVSTIGLMITLWYITEGFNLMDFDPHSGKRCAPDCKKLHLTSFDLIAYCFWTLVPPMWFFIEYIWFFPEDLKFNVNQATDFKYVVELSSKVWVAILVGISVILYLKYQIKLP